MFFSKKKKHWYTKIKTPDNWVPKVWSYDLTSERKRHSSENRAFSAPLVRCSIAPMLLSLCRVAQFVPCCSVCAVLLICAVLLSLCNICAQETLSNKLWPSLGNKLIKSNFRERKKSVTQVMAFVFTFTCPASYMIMSNTITQNNLFLYPYPEIYGPRSSLFAKLSQKPQLQAAAQAGWALAVYSISPPTPSPHPPPRTRRGLTYISF